MATAKRNAKSKPALTTSSKKGVWQVQTAKAQFSELLRRARTEGAQIVTRQGKEDVVVLPIEQYRKLTRRSRQPTSLVQFFAQSPLANLDLHLERDRDPGRDIQI